MTIIDKNETTSNMAIITYQRIYDWVSSKYFDKVRNNYSFKEVENLLNQLNKIY